MLFLWSLVRWHEKTIYKNYLSSCIRILWPFVALIDELNGESRLQNLPESCHSVQRQCFYVWLRCDIWWWTLEEEFVEMHLCINISKEPGIHQSIMRGSLVLLLPSLGVAFLQTSHQRARGEKEHKGHSRRPAEILSITLWQKSTMLCLERRSNVHQQQNLSPAVTHVGGGIMGWGCCAASGTEPLTVTEGTMS